MSFIQLNGIEEVREPQAAPEGRYTLRVVNAKMNRNEESGKTSIQTIIEIDGEPDYSNIFHYIGLPSEDDEPDKKHTKLLMMKRFLHAFGIPVEEGGVNTEAMVGAIAENMPVAQREYNDRIQNEIKLPPLPQED